MVEAVSIPLIKIILFLAALYAPESTAEIRIEHSDIVQTYVRDSGMWVSKNDSSDAFVIRGDKILSSSGVIDLASEIAGISAHDWSVESVLRIGSGIEVLKTRNGLLIYPEGLRGAGEPIRVEYLTGNRRIEIRTDE